MRTGASVRYSTRQRCLSAAAFSTRSSVSSSAKLRVPNRDGLPFMPARSFGRADIHIALVKSEASPSPVRFRRASNRDGETETGRSWPRPIRTTGTGGSNPSCSPTSPNLRLTCRNSPRVGAMRPHHRHRRELKCRVMPRHFDFLSVGEEFGADALSGRCLGRAHCMVEICGHRERCDERQCPRNGTNVPDY